jgi:RNA polymerase sigma factor (sigma-70 family)
MKEPIKEPRVSRPKISYEECDRLVLAYRDDCDSEAAQSLLDAFEGYIVKYYNVIRRGKIAINDRDIREFLKLYMKNEYCRRHIHQFKRMPIVQQEIYIVGDSVRNLCLSYSDEELLNEIYVAFLTMAKRYQSPDGKPRFHSYILQAFHYQLRRQLQTLVSDPIVFKMKHNVHFLDDEWDGDIKGNYIEYFEDERPVFTIEEEFDTINDNWILGYTTGEEYRDLTIMERKIIKMYYLDEMSDQDIADQLGTCRATVNRRRNRVKDKLQITLKEANKISR